MQDFITLVSGLPRSGTSMMMKMLEAGGLPLLVDEERPADDSNPKGYYEFQRVKKLDKGDTEWLEFARGKTVKVISALLKHLPPTYPYKIIFMRRDMAEILASQRKMLASRGDTGSGLPDGQMAKIFSSHLAEVEAWLSQQSNLETIYIQYNEIITNPQPHVERIQQFLAVPLDLEHMVSVVDASLYRQRFSGSS